MDKKKIKFDGVIKPDTKLAEEYLQQAQKEFHSKGYKDDGKRGHDSCKNLIYYADYTKFRGAMTLVQNVSEIPMKLFNLAKKIEENIDLFCQLEYMIRNIPIHETKNVDLRLVIQNLLHYSSGIATKYTRDGGFMWSISVSAETSLTALGCIAQALMSSVTHVTIECTAPVAVVCCLFTDLCHQVGLREKVRLAIIEEKLSRGISTTVDLKEVYELKSGCIGIVTGKSDVDSAVDTFLAATDRYPWNIKRILVQENVLERFKKSLEWRTRSELNTQRLSTYDHLKALSTNTYIYEAKMFLYEYSGTEIDEDVANVILIHSYRTTKELISLSKVSSYYAASLWCNDITESNEIAYNISANIIWINDLCEFNGPPKSSKAFYSLISSHFSTASILECTEIDEVMKLREPWLKISKSKREDIVKDILKNAPKPKQPRHEINVSDIDYAYDNFAWVEGRTICIGTEMTPIVMKSFDPLCVSVGIFIAKGGGLIISGLKYSDDYTRFVYESLREKGAPVVGVEDSFRSHLGHVRVLGNPLYKMKVIWSHFGTTFSN